MAHEADQDITARPRGRKRRVLRNVLRVLFVVLMGALLAAWLSREQIADDFIGGALAGELVGIAEIDDGVHIVRFAGRDLGLLDRHGRLLRFAPPRARLRAAPEPAVPAEQ